MNKSSSIENLASLLRAHVRQLTPGDRLPSSRELMRRHQVGPATVSGALALLATEGMVVPRPGSGTYVAPRRPAHDTGSGRGEDTSWQTVALGDRAVDASALVETLTPVAQGEIPLTGGYLHHSLQPLRALSAALSRASRRPESWDRPPLTGLAELRAWFARTVGGDATRAEVLITGGGQGALSAAFRSIVPAGGVILVESPTYPGALAVARASGLRPVPVPTDSDGLRPDLLAEAFAMTEARAVYCQPTYHNPTGTVLSPERRRQVLDVAREAHAFVIEDDASRWLGHEAAPPPPLAADDPMGTVVHLSSLTKVTAASLRVGAIIARGPVAERIRSVRIVDDFFVARPLQEAALELVSSPAWSRHLKGVSAALAERRRALASAVAGELGEAMLTRIPTGGLHLWLRLPDGTDETAMVAAARRVGVVVGSGRPFFAAEPPGPHVRLGFAMAAGLTDLTEGVHRLARVWERPR